jgi:putative transposase
LAHAEAVALFRSEMVGALMRHGLDRGELATALSELSPQRFRPPGAKSTKTYSVATLERWYYAYKSGGLEALRPSPSSDRGRCRDLTAEQRKLLLGIREEHPQASVPVILRTLVAEGRLEQRTSRRRFREGSWIGRECAEGGLGGPKRVSTRRGAPHAAAGCQAAGRCAMAAIGLC